MSHRDFDAAGELHGQHELVVEQLQHVAHSLLATVRQPPQHWAAQEHRPRAQGQRLYVFVLCYVK